MDKPNSTESADTQEDTSVQEVEATPLAPTTVPGLKLEYFSREESKEKALSALEKVIAVVQKQYNALPIVPGNTHLGEARGALDNILLQLRYDHTTIGGHH